MYAYVLPIFVVIGPHGDGPRESQGVFEKGRVLPGGVWDHQKNLCI